MTQLAIKTTETTLATAGLPLTLQVMNILRGIRERRADGGDYDESAGLTDAGFTSLEMVKAMLGVEAHFDIMIPARDITPANFATATAIARLVDRVLAAA